MHKINLKMEDLFENKNLSSWVDKLLSYGKNSFSVDDVKKEFPAQSRVAIRRSLNRLTVKNKIISVYKSFYLIIPPQYYSKGILPPALFIDKLMNYVGKPYYVGLLSSASLYGASHQQPQEYFVITDFPAMRPTIKKGIIINYISRRKIPEFLLETSKTDSGYIKVSSPVLTALDLIQFEKRIGGLNRASAVLSELADEIKPENLNDDLLKASQVKSIQRLGYIFENVIMRKELADVLYEQCIKSKIVFYRTALKNSARLKGYMFDKKWKIIVNIKIETEL